MRYGIHDRALEWFVSYLSDRTQFVKLDGSSSHSIDRLHVTSRGHPNMVFGHVVAQPVYFKVQNYTCGRCEVA